MVRAPGESSRRKPIDQLVEYGNHEQLIFSSDRDRRGESAREQVSSFSIYVYRSRSSAVRSSFVNMQVGEHPRSTVAEIICTVSEITCMVSEFSRLHIGTAQQFR